MALERMNLRQVAAAAAQDTLPAEDTSPVNNIGGATVLSSPPPVAVRQEVPAPMTIPQVPVQTGPVPSMAGLDDAALQSQTAPVPVEMVPETPTSQYQSFDADGTYSQSQLDIIAKYAPDLSNDQVDKLIRPIFVELDHRVELAMTSPDTGAEIQAAMDWMIDSIKKANADNKVTSAEIRINKVDDINGLGLTAEEHSKLERVKKIKLILVEDQELKNIKIETPPERNRADFIRYISNTNTRYQVPLPVLGDFITLNGAQIPQFVGALESNDASSAERLNLRASLIYDKLIGGTILHPYDNMGRRTMTYDNFINLMPLQDIEIAIYGILCASSAEDNSTSMTCNACGHKWEHQYKLQSLLNLDAMPEFYKDRTTQILKAKTNEVEIRKLYEENHMATRYKSPWTDTIFEISYPTVGRAINILRHIADGDDAMEYVATVCMYLSRILVFNPANQTYVPVTNDDVTTMIDAVRNLPQNDTQLIIDQVQSMSYTPQFNLHVTCPNCHNESDVSVSVSDLVFLWAQGFTGEIAE